MPKQRVRDAAVTRRVRRAGRGCTACRRRRRATTPGAYALRENYIIISRIVNKYGGAGLLHQARMGLILSGSEKLWCGDKIPDATPLAMRGLPVQLGCGDDGVCGAS